MGCPYSTCIKHERRKTSLAWSSVEETQAQESCKPRCSAAPLEDHNFTGRQQSDMDILLLTWLFVAFLFEKINKNESTVQPCQGRHHIDKLHNTLRSEENHRE